MHGQELAEALARAAIDAVEPRRCTREAIARAAIDRPVVLFAFGKAARGMAEAALECVEVARGIVIAPDDAPIGALAVRRGGHPAPSADAIAHGDEVLALARSLGEDDLALVLISGGGSSMLERPIDGIAIEEIAETSRELMRSGTDIAGLNTVRRCLSEIKGGGLARALAPARVVAIVISDVPGRPISVVASGPCSSPEGWPDPRDVIDRHGTSARLSARVRAAIRRRATERAPADAFARVRLELAASNETAVEAARAEAEARGLRLERLAQPISGDAYVAAYDLATRALGTRRARGADGWIGGGETTVRVPPESAGRGGRNQHAALALACAGEEWLDGALFVAIATDGVDGSSDAAGAWVDRTVIARARALGIDPLRYLDARDSHTFFDRVGARIVTGPTGTNVADVWCVAFRPD